MKHKIKCTHAFSHAQFTKITDALRSLEVCCVLRVVCVYLMCVCAHIADQNRCASVFFSVLSIQVALSCDCCYCTRLLFVTGVFHSHARTEKLCNYSTIVEECARYDGVHVFTTNHIRVRHAQLGENQ